MADREYLLKWIIDPTKAVSGAQAIERALLDLERICDRVGPKLKNIAAGASTPMGKASRSAKALAGDLQALEARAQTAGTAVQGVGAAAGQITGGLNRANGGTRRLAEGFAAMAGSMATIQGIRAAVSALDDGLKAARDYAHQTAEENIRLRDSLRELAANRGEPGPTDQTEFSVVDLMLRSGATADEARDFDTMWQSTIPAARQAGRQGVGMKLSPEQEEELRGKVLAFAIQKGVNPSTIGELVAAIGIHENITSVDQMMSKVGALHQIGGNEGMGKIDALYAAMNKLRPMVRPEGGGLATSNEEADAILGLVTTISKSPATAATNIERVMRESNKPAGEAIGIKPKDDYPTRLEKFKAVIDKGVAAGRSEGQALYDAGFHLDAANRTIIAQTRRIPEMREQIGRAKQGFDPRQLDADFEQFKATNPDRFTAAQEYAADRLRGQRREKLESARKSVRAAMKEAQVIETPMSSAIDAIYNVVPRVLRSAVGGTAEDAEDRRADIEIRRRILAADPSMVEKFPRLGDSAINWGGEAGGDELGEILNQLPPDVQAKVMSGSSHLDARVQDLKSGKGKAARAAMPPGGRGILGPAAGPHAALGKAANGLELAGLDLGGRGGDVMDGITTLERRTDGKGNDTDGIVTAPLRFDGKGGDVMTGIIPAVRRVPSGVVAGGAPGGQDRGQGDAPGHAKIDASGLDRAADKLNQAAQALIVASRSGDGGSILDFHNSQIFPDLGAGFGPVRS